ncbi:calcium-binding protein [Halocynthiibacter sp.]|uniref:calcium-binding protein n=1 Tax=Halocynthiibacter sp. TaxID=1979210 RepID=UPI003C5B9AF5
MLGLFSLLGALVVGSAVGMSDILSESDDEKPQEDENGLDAGPEHPVSEVIDPSEFLGDDPDSSAARGSIVDDIVSGAENTDILNGYEGDDLLDGNGGDDWIDGGAGNDRLFGDAGGDELHGGSGDDEIYGGDGDDEIFGETGDDTLIGGAGDDAVVGADGDDHLSGGEGDDDLLGGAGDDALTGGLGEDSLQGGEGDDTLTGAVIDETTGIDQDVRDFLNGGLGEDDITLGVGDIASGGEGADTFRLGGWNITDEIESGATIMDYNAQEDEIILIWDEIRDGSAEITVEPDPENPDTSQIMLNGKLVASVLNGAGLSAGQISLVAPES